MMLLKIKDNSQHKKEDFSQIKNLTGKIADKTLEQLEREDVFVFPNSVKDADDITQDEIILQSVNDAYRSGNVMGFLGYGDERLIIESRFCGGEDYFFQYLLNKVLDFPNFVDLEINANHDDRMFNFFLFLFPHYLKVAMRKGLFKKYIRHSYNDGDVKGTIDVARHIEVNTPFVGNIAYSQREFSYDNSLMELVRHTIEFIKRRKPYGNKLLVKVKEEVKLVIDATPGYEFYDRQKIIEQNKKNGVRHAYFREYLALQRLCLLIFRYQKHQIGLGVKRVCGILFDGAWLWEEYINSLIWHTFYHPMNKKGTGAQRLFDGNTGVVYPDFISRNSEKRMIADAKYKPNNNIGNHDYLQVLAYMFRFDAKVGYYLYPEAENADDLILRMNQGSTYEKNVMPREDISVTKHGLKIPIDVQDYEDFRKKIEESEKKFKSVFLSDDLETTDNNV